MKEKINPGERVSRIIILLLSGIVFTSVQAQTGAQTTAQQRAENLRSQMAEVQLKQSELQTRLDQLEVDLKPENIEHSLAGVGSVHPEELREQRRRQLEREKSYVVAQLNELAASRARLETAIAQADAEAYRQIVGPNVNDRADVYNTPTGTRPRASIATSRNRSSRARRQRVRKHRQLRRVVKP
jgi:membrane protein involved in colicin uptake